MFSSRGLFSHLPCPGKHDCTLPNCLFKHDDSEHQEFSSDMVQMYDPATVEPPDSPPPKRRKLEHPSSMKDETSKVKHNPLHSGEVSSGDIQGLPFHSVKPTKSSLKRALPEMTTSRAEEKATKKPKVAEQPSNSLTTSTKNAEAINGQLASVTRPVSPPPVNRAQEKPQAVPNPALKIMKEEPLQPRFIGHNPLQYPERDKKLKLFHKQLEIRHDRLRQELKNEPKFLMTAKELQKLAIDEEEHTAKASSDPTTYTNLLKDRLSYYKNMPADKWKEIFPTLHQGVINPSFAVSQPKIGPSTDKNALGDAVQQIAILKLLRTGLHQHAKHGYIIKPPSDKDIANAKSVQIVTGGFENCDRCSTRFQVIPGRNAEGQLTTRGPCHYHWGRIPLYRGAPRGNFPCCGQEPGSAGCTSADHHVFKVSDPARLASLLQFRETTAHRDEKKRGPVVFDCEMGYTTCGMELIRLTALSWPTKKVLVDVLVRPIGEVLDLNTRFSGVTIESFANAPNWGHNSQPVKYGPGEQLQKVASPVAARDLLFDLLNPDTPLIGHAIDNDLNVCRVIHPFVIDTVLLYPHPRGLPIRFKLKDLAKQFLGITIQAGGADGHDSKEDSEATGDLVLCKVHDKWRQLRQDGWWWKENTLMPPKGKAAST